MNMNMSNINSSKRPVVLEKVRLTRSWNVRERVREHVREHACSRVRDRVQNRELR